MSKKELKEVSVIDLFNAHSETLEDAQKKNASESSGRRLEMFRMDKEGKYKVRILPLAPIPNDNGEYELPRKGYEYPAKELLLKIQTGTTKDGKPQITYVNVRHLKNIFPALEGADLIDLFVQIACEKYSDDEKLCKAIRDNSFSGGLRYDTKRYMYVLNMDKREDGIRMLALSYAQYKELEERKLDLWKELREDDPKAFCPISSVENAYPVEITRKKENGKTSYVFNINTRREAPLSEEELQKLLDLPRLPEQLYRYTRYHLEATLYFLKQYEEKKDIDVLSDERITDLVEKIKILLPSDDTSHFNPNNSKGSSEDGATGSKMTFDQLCDTYDAIVNAGQDDKSEDGLNLRTAMMEFISDNDLDVSVSRRMTNADILDEIEDALKNNAENGKKPAPASENDSEEDDERESADPDDVDPEEAEPSDPSDDTAEPAARTDRRANRPARRRR